MTKVFLGVISGVDVLRVPYFVYVFSRQCKTELEPRSYRISLLMKKLLTPETS